jgi:hypothetical protein
MAIEDTKKKIDEERYNFNLAFSNLIGFCLKKKQEAIIKVYKVL